MVEFVHVSVPLPRLPWMKMITLWRGSLLPRCIRLVE